MSIQIIYVDRNFLVLDKPAGVSVHRVRLSDGQDAGLKGGTVVDWLVEKHPEIKRVGDDPALRPGIVHRLDKDTSGVMVVARTQEAFKALKQLFKERRVEKTYLALVVGVPKKKSGLIDAPIGRSLRQPLKRAAGARARGAHRAATTYRLLERLGNYSLLEVKPQTGRTHQIRVHFKFIGCPVAGDRMYGGSQAAILGLERQFLHASKLEFSYPEGRRWRFEAALPEDLDRVLKRLRRLRKR
jgi:23S rRNA pseudouridine1911/1915/1917 synthase